MRNLKSKLRQSRGASIIIAMVFMLMCVFVGGSVLTAATANASRVRHLAKTQEFLNQKSAAMILCDELRVPEDAQLKLIIRKTGNKDLRFSPSINKDNMTPMQKVVYEAAVQRYLVKNGLSSPNAVFDSSFHRTSLNQFWVKAPGSNWGATRTQPIKITGPSVDGEAVEISADFLCDEDYNFTLHFGDPSFMEVSMKAYEAQSEVKTEVPTPDGEGFITQTTTVTVVYWTDPVIVKGDAE